MRPLLTQLAASSTSLGAKHTRGILQRIVSKVTGTGVLVRLLISFHADVPAQMLTRRSGDLGKPRSVSAQSSALYGRFRSFAFR